MVTGARGATVPKEERPPVGAEDPTGEVPPVVGGTYASFDMTTTATRRELTHCLIE